MTPEHKKVAGDVCFFLREGEKDVQAIAEVAGCSTGTVYKYRRMLYPEGKRKYSKRRNKTKKLLTAKFSDNNSTVMFLPSGDTTADLVKKIEKQSEKFFEDIAVNHPPHYTAGGIETYDFIAAKGLSFELGNVVKYVTRADHKGNRLQDLKKAQWYLNAAISREEKSNG
jgi:hypothetical protein